MTTNNPVEPSEAKPPCAICGQTLSRHNMGHGVPMCPVYATYRPAMQSAASPVGDEVRDFAWTATEDYGQYPPYVNLTGNRLAVRGPEKCDSGGGFAIPGDYVVIDLPKPIAADLLSRLDTRNQHDTTDTDTRT